MTSTRPSAQRRWTVSGSYPSPPPSASTSAITQGTQPSVGLPPVPPGHIHFVAENAASYRRWSVSESHPNLLPVMCMYCLLHVPIVGNDIESNADQSLRHATTSVTTKLAEDRYTNQCWCFSSTRCVILRRPSIVAPCRLFNLRREVTLLIVLGSLP
ncbi:hypothetical protein BCR39DRAFT_554094 [Naematelia encephala]|uniref:Uncharacterized protein n=1 Tax=Naematelia encephala TaxID=71784 RepID=A0A1Y2AFK5_9TREE|nr:hypothetical protein BCR39DRAFT_554094 [Naematelia encephala]